MSDMEYKNGSLCVKKLNIDENISYSSEHDVFMSTVIDSSGRIIESIKNDGTHFISKLQSPTLDEQSDEIKDYVKEYVDQKVVGERKDKIPYNDTLFVDGRYFNIYNPYKKSIKSFNVNVTESNEEPASGINLDQNLNLTSGKYSMRDIIKSYPELYSYLPDIVGESVSLYYEASNNYTIWTITRITQEQFAGQMHCHDWNYQLYTPSKSSNTEDGSDVDFIFSRNNTGNIPSKPSDTSIGDIPSGWTNRAQGVASNMKYEYLSVRYFDGEFWSEFSKPVIWSIFGEIGKDGDGCEYIFKLTATSTPPSKPNDDSNPDRQNNGYTPEGWTKTPDDVSIDMPYLWAYIRTRYTTNGMSWRPWEQTPILWKEYGDNSETHYEFRYNNSEFQPNKPTGEGRTDGWSEIETDPDLSLPEYTWMSQSYVDHGAYNEWSTPVRITGGTAGGRRYIKVPISTAGTFRDFVVMDARGILTKLQDSVDSQFAFAHKNVDYDFMTITNYNTFSDYSVQPNPMPDNFIWLANAFEVSTGGWDSTGQAKDRGSHINVYSTNFGLKAQDWKPVDVIDYCSDRNCFTSWNHPFISALYNTPEYVKNVKDRLRFIEVYNGLSVIHADIAPGVPSVRPNIMLDEDFDALISQGNFTFATSVSDERTLTVSSSSPLRFGCVKVFADNLTQEEILNSLFTGNFYASSFCRKDLKLRSISLEDGYYTIDVGIENTIVEFVKAGNIVEETVHVSNDNNLTATYKIKGTEGVIRARIYKLNGQEEDPTAWHKNKEWIMWTQPIFISDKLI